MSKWKKSSKQLVEAFYSTLGENPLLDLRKMFGYPCAFIRGNMCTGLHEENWIIRLSEEDRSEMRKKYSVAPFAPMEGRVMREYVAIPEEVKRNPDLLHEWIEKSIAFTSSLPEKLPKKRKSKISIKK